MYGAAGNVGFHLIRRQLAAPEAIDEVPDLCAVPADLGFSMRFHPTALLDALVDHVTAVESSSDFWPSFPVKILDRRSTRDS